MLAESTLAVVQLRFRFSVSWGLLPTTFFFHNWYPVISLVSFYVIVYDNQLTNRTIYIVKHCLCMAHGQFYLISNHVLLCHLNHLYPLNSPFLFHAIFFTFLILLVFSPLSYSPIRLLEVCVPLPKIFIKRQVPLKVSLLQDLKDFFQK